GQRNGLELNKELDDDRFTHRHFNMSGCFKIAKIKCLQKLSSIVPNRSYASQPEGASKAVLVTGCDSGFGFSLAKHLHGKGFTVFAGCLLKIQFEIHKRSQYYLS
ncbi:unnamed protein product, partial [Ranitomeya imitator]